MGRAVDKRLTVIAGVTALLLWGAMCAQHADDGETRTKSGEPYLGHIVTQNHRIDVVSAADGVRYTVKTLDGALLVEAASQATLESEHPDLWGEVKDAIVAQRGGGLSATATTN